MNKKLLIGFALSIITTGTLGYFIYTKTGVSADALSSGDLSCSGATKVVGELAFYNPDGSYFIAEQSTKLPVNSDTSTVYILSGTTLYSASGVQYQTMPTSTSNQRVAKVGAVYYLMDLDSATPVSDSEINTKTQSILYVYDGYLYVKKSAVSNPTDTDKSALLSDSKTVCLSDTRLLEKQPSVFVRRVFSDTLQ